MSKNKKIAQKRIMKRPSGAAKDPVFLSTALKLAISGFRAIDAENGAKIFDLRRFFKKTRYCGNTCIKTAYMVKFGRKSKGCCARFFM
jgi:hypothetical protein